MSVIDVIGLIVAALAYHEGAHAIAADRYGALVALNLTVPKSRLGKLFVLAGPAIQVDDDKLTERQFIVTFLAPLVYLPLAVGTYFVWKYTGHSFWGTGTLVLTMAGGATFMSDIPMYLTDNMADDQYHSYTLYRFADGDTA